MRTDELSNTLLTLFDELVRGAPGTGAFVLNPGDRGLLASLDRLSAAAASASHRGGGTIAAHTGHVRYGLSLLNQWAAGANPFADADWSAAWQITSVSDAEWAALRDGLRGEVDAWRSVLDAPREVNSIELGGMIGSVVHLAYHLGAIRQIDASLRGPRQDEASD